ncbi:hypothetical protein F5I97DRAFT_1969907 [Phlebopus sp. FC_14]|nr:hypothetical protein F5I97DRAFT_1969907 [Phlebopus sp. FC_14]
MSLDAFQQVYSLSRTSNMVNGYIGTQAHLQATLTDSVHAYVPTIGDWKIVWGPVVWKDQPNIPITGPDNSWFVAYNPSFTFEDGSVHPTYVVAIAGTASYSLYGWTQENFAVGTIVDFNKWVAEGISKAPEAVWPKDITTDGTYVSMGTIKAVHTLLTFPAPPGTAAAGSSLLQFLSTLNDSSQARVVCTGHSLGGALSPTLALTLVSSGTFQAALGPSPGVLAYPTAGASPGNRSFADLFAKTLPARKSPGSELGGYQVWNLNIANSLDVVPQAWCIMPEHSLAQNVDNIPTIYPLHSSLQHHLVSGVRPEAPPMTIIEFLNLASPQHTTFYLELLGVPEPEVSKTVVRQYGLVEKAENEKRLGIPVIGNVEYAAEHPTEVQNAVSEAIAKNPALAPLANGLSSVGSGISSIITTKLF